MKGGQPRIVDFTYRPGNGLIPALFLLFQALEIANRSRRTDVARCSRDSTVQIFDAGVGREALIGVLNDDAGRVAVRVGVGCPGCDYAR